MQRKKQWAQACAVLVIASALGACGGGDGSTGFAATGTASFDATDAPVDDVSRVTITFDRIDMQPADGDRVTVEFDTPRTIANLLALTGDSSEVILEDTTVPAGEYVWLRLYVLGGSPDSEVERDDGQVFPLFVPGSQPQSGNPNSRFLHLNTGFVVPAGGDADFTIDFVLRQALTRPANQDHYLLRPSMRLVDNVEVGSIAGIVDEPLVTDASCTNDPAADEGNSVYLYAGSDAVPGDVNVDPQTGEPDHDSDDTDGVSPETHPLTTAEVRQNPDTGTYQYRIGFVAEGDYTVAFTCQSLDDLPDSDEDIAFAQSANVTVVAGETTTQNFTTAP